MSRSYCNCFRCNGFLRTICCQSPGYYTILLAAQINGSLNKARSGCTVVVPFREEMNKRHLKVAGDLGRVVFLVISAPIDEKHKFLTMIGI